LNDHLGNIRSEVSHVIHWHKTRNALQADKALDRVLELIDLTLTDKRWRSRWMEIAPLREALCDRFAGNRTFEISLKILEDYFLVFALRITS
jgi:hypothetical protein